MRRSICGSSTTFLYPPPASQEFFRSHFFFLNNGGVEASGMHPSTAPPPLRSTWFLEFARMGGRFYCVIRAPSTFDEVLSIVLFVNTVSTVKGPCLGDTF